MAPGALKLLKLFKVLKVLKVSVAPGALKLLKVLVAQGAPIKTFKSFEKFWWPREL